MNSEGRRQRSKLYRKGDDDMTNVHVLKDESLGGVKREYVEVERKADVGDFILNNKGNEFESYYVVTGFTSHYTSSYKVAETADGTIAVSIARSITLEPTDIVIIGGKRYKIEERLAEPGELILNKSNGLTYEVKDVAGDFIIVGDSQLMLEEDYVVLKRIDA